jgi:hypothetical protein
MSEAREPSHDSRPVPDPTLLTTQQLQREIAALKEVMFTRLNGMDRAIVLFNENITRVPTDTDRQIGHLKELMLETFKTVREQFNGVEKQFIERDVRVIQSATAATTAVNAALQAQKEAAGEQAKSFSLSVNKSEQSTLEQITQQRVLLQTATGSLNDKIDDVKQRLTTIEGQTRGNDTTNRLTSIEGQNKGKHDSSAAIIAAIVACTAVLGVIASFVAAMMLRH